MSGTQSAFPTGIGTPGMTQRQWYKGQILAGFCANPSIFAYNAKCGWGLVNASDEQLVAYVGQLADEALGEDANHEGKTTP